MIIQTILLYPPKAVWTDSPSNVSRLNPSGAVQADAEHPTRNRKVEGPWLQAQVKYVLKYGYGLLGLSRLASSDPDASTAADAIATTEARP
jgi:hypothetical protein